MTSRDVYERYDNSTDFRCFQIVFFGYRYIILGIDRLGFAQKDQKVSCSLSKHALTM